MKRLRDLTGGMLLLVTTSLNATTVTYDLSYDAGSDRWQYDYLVSNDDITHPTLSHGLFEFSVYFDLGLYENLSVISTPAGWNGVVVQPGSFMGLNDGYFDALSVAGIDNGDTAGLFSVQFDWLGTTGAPSAQFFEVVDPKTFVVIDDGMTVSAIPLPASVWLFMSGLLVLAGVRQRTDR